MKLFFLFNMMTISVLASNWDPRRYSNDLNRTLCSLVMPNHVVIQVPKNTRRMSVVTIPDLAI